MTYKEKINKIADQIQSDTNIEVHIEEMPKGLPEYIVIEYDGDILKYADNRVHRYKRNFTLTYGTKDRYKILELDDYIYKKFGVAKAFEFDDGNERYNSIYTIMVSI